MQTHNSKIQILPKGVAERLGYYVYILIDPRDNVPFYVGKGQGERLLSHGLEADLESEQDQPAKIKRIREIRRDGQEPKIVVLRHTLSEADAFLIEASVIDAFDGKLTNRIRGRGTVGGVAPLEELISAYGAPDLITLTPAILITLRPWVVFPEDLEPGHLRPGYGWKPGQSPEELFDMSRGWWKLNPDTAKRKSAEYVVTAFEGITRTVCKLNGWLPPFTDSKGRKRWCFQGSLISSGPIWEDFVGAFGKRVPVVDGARNPIRYWP
jgi:uncharacterized protein